MNRIVDAITQGAEGVKVELERHAAMPRVLDQPGKVPRDRGHQPQEVGERRLAAPQRVHRLIARGHGAAKKRLRALDQPELRIVLAAESLESDERLKQES